jgi:DNA-binding HxlR family transcriptional regulator
MSRTRFDQMNCSAALALDHIGDWWTLLIVREAFYGTKHFTGFQRRLGISKNVLADRLQHLCANGTLRRIVPNEGVDRHIYVLTDKGRDLLPVLVALMQWGDRWISGKGAEPVSIYDNETGQPIARVSVFDARQRELQARDLKFAPGPGAKVELRQRFESVGQTAQKE